MHNVSLRIREDHGPSLLHHPPAELPTHNNREKGDYSCKALEIGTAYTKALSQSVSDTLAHTNVRLHAHTLIETHHCVWCDQNTQVIIPMYTLH